MWCAYPDGFLNRIANTLQKDFITKLSVRFLHLVDSVSSQAGVGTLWLEVTSSTVDVCQDIGPWFTAHLVGSSTHIYYLQVIWPIVRNVTAGVFNEASQLYPLVQQLLPGSGYIICPGIHDYSDRYSQQVRYCQFKSLQTIKIGDKAVCYELINCRLWHKLPEVKGKTASRRHNMCNECKEIDLVVNRKANRESKVPQAQKALCTFKWLKLPCFLAFSFLTKSESA